jgi:ABC-type multidrug transport system ATPase subunit
MPATIGYVPEGLAARSKLTEAEYVAHMGRIRGLDSEAIYSRSRELFERLDLQPGPDVMSDQLSQTRKSLTWGFRWRRRDSNPRTS